MKRRAAILFSLSAASTPAFAETVQAVRHGEEEVSSAKNEYNFQISNDRRLRLFARGEADFSNSKILVSQRGADGWMPPWPIVFSDERFKDSDPWLSQDGGTLYFISNRRATAAATDAQDEETYDIWRTRKAGGTWLAPEHLGGVNSDANEFGPTAYGDYLYFGSNRSGNYDIYRAPLDRLSDPEPLPAPINSEAVDNDFVLSPDGHVAIWSSSRPGGYGRSDLYVSRFDGENWTPAQNLGPGVNSDAAEFTPRFSPDGARLYFASSRRRPDQDDGAADIYEIAVRDAPALAAQMSASALERLKEAFGGETALNSIRSISFSLETQTGEGGPEQARYTFDFAREVVALRARLGEREEVTYIRGDRGERNINGAIEKLSAGERAGILDFLHLNFLYFLTRRDIALTGPFESKQAGDLGWYKLSANSVVSPLLGLDPRTGRIVKIAVGDGVEVLELDYMRTRSDIVWPHRYLVLSGGHVERQGRFIDLRVNVPLPADAPSWVRN